MPRRLVEALWRLGRRKRKDGSPRKRSTLRKGAFRYESPKMVIAGGTIDWEQSDLDDCRISPSASSYVTYMAHGATVASPVVRSAGLGAMIFGNQSVLGNQIEPSECGLMYPWLLARFVRCLMLWPPLLLSLWHSR